MKPFDLEAAKRGEPICGKDGEPYRFICFDEQSEKVVYGYGTNQICSTHFVIARACIYMAPKKRTVWVNLYPWGIVEDDHQFANWYDSEAEANDGSAYDRIGGKAYPVEIDA